jgi:hypothetical protein
VALSLLGLLMAASSSIGQTATPVSIQPKASGTPTADREDVMVLLEGAPLHVRLNVSLGGVSLAQSRREYVVKMMARLDTDKDGKLTRAEADRSPILRTKQRPGAREFLESLRAQTVLMPRDLAQKVNVIGGEFVACRDDMTSAKNDIEVFKLLDANANSQLDPGEIAAAAELIMSKDEDGDQCVAFQEFFPPPPPPIRWRRPCSRPTRHFRRSPACRNWCAKPATSRSASDSCGATTRIAILPWTRRS